ncbi:MerR family transcriptional regulator [Dielma fastidiosa]|uniref:MerR family transcriptional regulator n=1 Tax=Dielma fastidiosa TaxID=1034346 RepID=A0AB35UKN1_9FIRM|nr:MerR family transcriptional regulator [Dielma fastidiosa]MDY5167039.1 MerR family transcriptional regulator [Dielma fastidiosa]
MNKDNKNAVKEPKIGMNELCLLLGSSPNSVRNYDAHQAINSRRKENGYRFYYFNDVQQAIKLKSLIRLGFSIEEAKSMCLTSSIDMVYHKFDSKADELQNEITSLTNQLNYLKSLQQDLKDLEALKGNFIIEQRPALYWLQCQSEDEIIKYKENQEMLRQWTQFFPFVESCPRLPIENLNEYSNAEMGLGLKEEFVKMLDFKDLSNCIYYPSTQCIKTVIKANVKVEDYYSVVSHVFKYMKENDLKLSDDIINFLVMSDMKLDDDDDYYDYYFAYFPFK